VHGVHNPLSDRLYLFGTDLRKGAYWVLAILLAIPPLNCLHSCCFKWRYDRRNAPDSAALLGATEPHLNSSDLVAITLAANVLPTSK
jgi:hypothetical protein